MKKKSCTKSTRNATRSRMQIHSALAERIAGGRAKKKHKSIWMWCVQQGRALRISRLPPFHHGWCGAGRAFNFNIMSPLGMQFRSFCTVDANASLIISFHSHCACQLPRQKAASPPASQPARDECTCSICVT